MFQQHVLDLEKVHNQKKQIYEEEIQRLKKEIEMRTGVQQPSTHLPSSQENPVSGNNQQNQKALPNILSASAPPGLPGILLFIHTFSLTNSE